MIYMLSIMDIIIFIEYRIDSNKFECNDGSSIKKLFNCILATYDEMWCSENRFDGMKS